MNRSHLSVTDVAEQTGRDPRTIRRLIADGFIEAEMHDGRWEIPAPALKRLLPKIKNGHRFIRPHPGSRNWRKNRLAKSDNRA